jgi:hypothetical protein
MERVMIRCPVTERAIPTGLEADRSTFNSTPVFFAEAHCPHCRMNHPWFARDAWIEDSANAVPQAA